MWSFSPLVKWGKTNLVPNRQGNVQRSLFFVSYITAHSWGTALNSQLIILMEGSRADVSYSINLTETKPYNYLPFAVIIIHNRTKLCWEYSLSFTKVTCKSFYTIVTQMREQVWICLIGAIFPLVLPKKVSCMCYAIPPSEIGKANHYYPYICAINLKTVVIIWNINLS